MNLFHFKMLTNEFQHNLTCNNTIVQPAGEIVIPFLLIYHNQTQWNQIIAHQNGWESDWGKLNLIEPVASCHGNNQFTKADAVLNNNLYHHRNWMDALDVLESLFALSHKLTLPIIFPGMYNAAQANFN